MSSKDAEEYSNFEEESDDGSNGSEFEIEPKNPVRTRYVLVSIPFPGRLEELFPFKRAFLEPVPGFSFLFGANN